MHLKKLTEKVEQVSKQYSSRYKIKRDDNWYILKLQEELGELIQSYLMMKGQARTKDKTKKEIKEDFQNEVADVLCHTLLLAKHAKIDLEKVVKRKWLKYTKKSSSDYMVK